jgi:type IV pilus modification protein PilV
MNAKPMAAAFSLIEVMIAILILGVGLVGLTDGITTALRSSKESERQTTAALLAAGQVETLRAQGSLQEETSEGDCGDALPGYRWKQSITSTRIDGLYQIDVSVEDSESDKPIYELTTLLFDPGSYSSVTPAPARTDSARSRRRRGRAQ